MVLSPSRPGMGRPYVPGKVAWSVLAGVMALATVLASTDLIHARDLDRTHLLTSEIAHAGA